MSGWNLGYTFDGTGFSQEAPDPNERWQDRLASEGGNMADTAELLMPNSAAARNLGVIGTGLQYGDFASHLFEGDFRGAVVDGFTIAGSAGGAVVGTAGGVAGGTLVGGPPGGAVGGTLGGIAGASIGGDIGTNAGEGVLQAYDLTAEVTSDLLGWSDPAPVSLGVTASGKSDRLSFAADGKTDRLSFAEDGKTDRFEFNTAERLGLNDDASAIPGLNAPAESPFGDPGAATRIDVDIPSGRVDDAFATTGATGIGGGVWAGNNPATSNVFGAGFDTGGWAGSDGSSSLGLSPGVSSSSGGPTFDATSSGVFGAGYDTGGWSGGSSSSDSVW